MERRRQVILLTDDTDMVGPSGGVFVAGLQDVLEHSVDSAAGIAPNIMEEAKCTQMEHPFNRKLAK